MKDTDPLDQQALAKAKDYMGDFAWPTVLIGLTVCTLYVAVVSLTLAGLLSLWISIPAVTFLSYLSYTVLHEAAHGSISGSHQSLRWINEALGYMAGWVIMIPLTAHRHEHLAHHRHTNDEARDPDFAVSRMRKSPVGALCASVKLLTGQFTYYMEHRWHKGPGKQNFILCLELTAILAPRIALLFTGYWMEAMSLFVLAWLLGVSLTLYLFAYLVHHPHEQTGRYIDTSTILIEGPLAKSITWLWMFQNYHSIHHLFPRVPFYQYTRLYGDISTLMDAKDAPVRRLGLGASWAGIQKAASS